jgi:hypothetical protein
VHERGANGQTAVPAAEQRAALGSGRKLAWGAGSRRG